uniref:Uncharacterized protein n=1 Tax=Mesocestoides corti TaxID=53468 RepID=A0A5K3EVX3_MESCO
MTTLAGIQGSLPLLTIEEKGLGFGSRYSNASAATNVKYPSPNKEKINTIEQALLTNHKPEPYVRRLPSDPPRWSRRSYILLLIRVFLWLAAYVPRMPLERRKTEDWLRPGGLICLHP